MTRLTVRGEGFATTPRTSPQRQRNSAGALLNVVIAKTQRLSVKSTHGVYIDTWSLHRHMESTSTHGVYRRPALPCRTRSSARSVSIKRVPLHLGAVNRPTVTAKAIYFASG